VDRAKDKALRLQLAGRFVLYQQALSLLNAVWVRLCHDLAFVLMLSPEAA
jgi:hypothetical protein